MSLIINNIIKIMIKHTDNIIKLTLENHDEYKEKNIIIKFSAIWCKPCTKLAPIYSNVAEFSIAIDNNLIFTHVDVDEQGALAQKYNISTLPTLIIVKHNEEIARHEGTLSDSELIKFINGCSNEHSLGKGIDNVPTCDVLRCV